MKNLMDRIQQEIDVKAMKSGKMGTERINVTLELTSEEMNEFYKINLDEHWNWEIESNTLFISYVEEL